MTTTLWATNFARRGAGHLVLLHFLVEFDIWVLRTSHPFSPHVSPYSLTLAVGLWFGLFLCCVCVLFGLFCLSCFPAFCKWQSSFQFLQLYSYRWPTMLSCSLGSAIKKKDINSQFIWLQYKYKILTRYFGLSGSPASSYSTPVLVVHTFCGVVYMSRSWVPLSGFA